MASSARSKQLGLGCLVLFILPFAAVGIGSIYWVYNLLSQQAAMKSWAEVPATIKQLALKHNHGRKNRTQQTIATYEYKFDGRKYLGDRVSLHSGSDNVGSFQRDVFNELNRHFTQKKPFRAFVNPASPEESVLYRDLRWEMLAFYTIFATVFSCIGLGGFFGIIAYARTRPGPVEGNVPNDQPWLARSDWASGQIHQTGDAVAVPVLAAVTIFWWLASGPLLAKLPEILPPAKGQLAWLTLAFPAVGLVLVAAIVHQFLRKQKFGKSTLELASTPGVVGGQLAGVVRIERIVQAEGGYRLKLSCVERVQRKNDDSASEEVLWQDERLVTEPMRDIATGTMALPVLFAIPYEAKETSHGSSKRDIDWRIEVSAKLPGVDYKSRFDVPVFKTPESRPDFKLDEKLSADFTAAPPNDLLLREAGIVKERLAGSGVRLVFPAARNLGSALVLTAFTAIWGAAIWFMLHLGAPILFPIVFGLFELLFLWIVAEMWLYRSVVEANADRLTYRGGYFGIGRKHSWTEAEIKHFETADSMSSGTHVWKHVVLLPKQGKKRTIGRTIPGKMAQQAVIDELNAALRRVSK